MKYGGKPLFKSRQVGEEGDGFDYFSTPDLFNQNDDNQVDVGLNCAGNCAKEWDSKRLQYKICGMRRCQVPMGKEVMTWKLWPEDSGQL